MSIYKLMEQDWETYCLMAGIMYIEEMSKPYSYTLTQSYMGNKKDYTCYRSLRLKGVSYEIIKKWFDITKKWEKKLSTKLIGNSFSDVSIESWSRQYKFHFTPNWLYLIMNTVKRLPSQDTQKVSINRLKNWKKGKTKFILSDIEIEEIISKPSLYPVLLKSEMLAAGALIVSFDLEFRGTTTGRLSLCMSEKYRDFLQYIFSISNTFGWTTTSDLVSVNVEYSRNLGINASNQFEFRISTKKLKKIYDLAGPLADPVKDKAISFHANRSYNYVNLGGKFNNKEKLIYTIIKSKKANKTTEIQYYLNIGTDVILKHLHKMEKKGLINKTRNGKRYIWSVKDAN